MPGCGLPRAAPDSPRLRHARRVASTQADSPSRTAGGELDRDQRTAGPQTPAAVRAVCEVGMHETGSPAGGWRFARCQDHRRAASEAGWPGHRDPASRCRWPGGRLRRYGRTSRPLLSTFDGEPRSGRGPPYAGSRSDQVPGHLVRKRTSGSRWWQRASVQAAPASAALPEPVAPERMRVLLIEDDDGDALLVEELLLDAGRAVPDDSGAIPRARHAL